MLRSPHPLRRRLRLRLGRGPGCMGRRWRRRRCGWVRWAPEAITALPPPRRRHWALWIKGFQCVTSFLAVFDSTMREEGWKGLDARRQLFATWRQPHHLGQGSTGTGDPGETPRLTPYGCPQTAPAKHDRVIGRPLAPAAQLSSRRSYDVAAAHICVRMDLLRFALCDVQTPRPCSRDVRRVEISTG
jgi:hypothetical protein